MVKLPVLTNRFLGQSRDSRSVKRSGVDMSPESKKNCVPFLFPAEIDAFFFSNKPKEPLGPCGPYRVFGECWNTASCFAFCNSSWFGSCCDYPLCYSPSSVLSVALWDACAQQ